jgi:hypothetical protein
MTDKKNIYEEISKVTGVPHFQRTTMRNLILSVQKNSEIFIVFGNKVTEEVSLILNPDILETINTEYKTKFYETFFANTDFEKKFYHDLLYCLDRSFFISRTELISGDTGGNKDHMIVWGFEIEKNGDPKILPRESHLISIYINPDYF